MIDRFIPAYAGNVACARASSSGLPVHPRIRGERLSARFMTASTTGSSPHTRGTFVVEEDNKAKKRFIPAYAGNVGP